MIESINRRRRLLRNELFLNFRSSLIARDILRSEPCRIGGEKILLSGRNLIVFVFQGFDFCPGVMVFFGNFSTLRLMQGRELGVLGSEVYWDGIYALLTAVDFLGPTSAIYSNS